MSKKNKLILGDVLGMIILILADQFTKYLAVIHLKDKPVIPIIQDVLELSYLENRGAAFGMLQNQKIFFVFVASIILAVIVYVIYKMPVDRKYAALMNESDYRKTKKHIISGGVDYTAASTEEEEAKRRYQ